MVTCFGSFFVLNKHLSWSTIFYHKVSFVSNKYKSICTSIHCRASRQTFRIWGTSEDRPWASKRKRSRCFLAFSSLFGYCFTIKKINWYEIVSNGFTELIWETLKGKMVLAMKTTRYEYRSWRLLHMRKSRMLFLFTRRGKYIWERANAL